MARSLALATAAALVLAVPSTASASLTWSAPIPLDHSGGTALLGIACPSTSQCAAVDTTGQVVVFNPNQVGASFRSS